jgi:hypothetical protein
MTWEVMADLAGAKGVPMATLSKPDLPVSPA